MVSVARAVFPELTGDAASTTALASDEDDDPLLTTGSALITLLVAGPVVAGGMVGAREMHATEGVTFGAETVGNGVTTGTIH